MTEPIAQSWSRIFTWLQKNAALLELAVAVQSAESQRVEAQVGKHG